jgi:hypothetical protein
MFSYIDNTGARQQVEITAEELFEGAKAGGVTPPVYLNKKFSDADLSIGPAFKQMQASMGICAPKGENPFGLKNVPLANLLAGTGGFTANTQQNTTPFGTASRAFTMISMVDGIESALAKDYETEIANVYSAIGTTITVASEHFEQPVINYGTLNGPESVTASRVSQGATPPKMAFFTTADRIRRIGSWTVGMEWTDQALKATSLDFVTMTMSRFLKVERDSRAARYIADAFVGNADLIVGAVSSVTSSALNGAPTAGVLTHRAWVKWLARNYKYRKITHVFCDIDTYMKVEGRTGRPGTTNYDPTLSRIDPQAVAMSQVFGGNVQFVIMPEAADGGPVPANTLYGLDSSSALTLVRNSSAAYQGVESFALKRTTAMRMDWAEEVMRTFGDTDLRAFDVLVID